MKQRKGWRMSYDVGKAAEGWRMSCDVGEATEGLENELWRRWSDGKVWEWALSLHLCHSSFSNSSFAFPTSQALHFCHLANRPWNKLFFNFSELHTTTTISELLCTVIVHSQNTFLSNCTSRANCHIFEWYGMWDACCRSPRGRGTHYHKHGINL